MSKDAARAIHESFVSPNECDRNMEPANVVDGLFAIARAINGLTNAIKLTEFYFDPDDPKNAPKSIFIKMKPPAEVKP